MSNIPEELSALSRVCEDRETAAMLTRAAIHVRAAESHIRDLEARLAALVPSQTAEPRHYPPGMGEESRRLHREYNALVAAQENGAKNGAEVVKLTDEAAAKGIVLVPRGEYL
jgi:deoxycytidylate deaminase